ncbi:DUF1850 domain-containing protein [Allopusillimonas ginsengisoli]|uniref:DUF1850 domain-containing protein n=1 Tax=Allopusillimonas ginsengisoli TaxID=453575 RepID=UPI0010218A25|nr:DUF1850 domain-containing protein [Allopusillimonas ginsengisoli]TEA78596.1 DUF1850 domain-containing protein [Allopusillimonas ginsengisoli]
MSVTAPVFGVCLALAAAPQVPPRFVPVHQFTLAWTHSIEKVRWEEDYRVLPPTIPGGSPTLVAGKARIRGSGAGMEPPPDAVFHDDWYEYQPEREPPPTLRLTRSIYTADFDWCMKGTCLPMSAIMPTDGDITLLYPCSAPS